MKIKTKRGARRIRNQRVIDGEWFFYRFVARKVVGNIVEYDRFQHGLTKVYDCPWSKVKEIAIDAYPDHTVFDITALNRV